MELANHHSRLRCGDQLSACDLYWPSRFSGERDAESSKGDSLCNSFFEKFYCSEFDRLNRSTPTPLYQLKIWRFTTSNKFRASLKKKIESQLWFFDRD
jgi:hypothetical protein